MGIWPTWVLGDLSAILCYMPCILHVWNLFHEDLNTFCWGRSKQMKASLAAQRNYSLRSRRPKAFCPVKPPAITSSSTGTGDCSTFKICSDEQRNTLDIKVAISEECCNERSLQEDHVSLRILSLKKIMGSCCQECNLHRHMIDAQRASSDAWNLELEGRCDASNPQHVWETPDFSLRKFLIRLAECVVLFMLLIFLSLFIFFDLGAPTNTFVQNLSYLVFPVVIWASFRFNRVGLPLSVVVVATIASVGTAKCHGPLYHSDSSDKSLLQVKYPMKVPCVSDQYLLGFEALSPK